MKYTEEEVGNIIKQVEANTGQRVANYKYVNYSATQLIGLNPEDFQANNQVLYGDWELGHFGNGDEFNLRYIDNYGNDTLVVSLLGKSDNLGAVKGVIFNWYGIYGNDATFSGILFNLVNVPAPALRFSFDKTNVNTTQIGFSVNTLYGLAGKIGNVYVDFGDGAGFVTFDKDTQGIANPNGNIPIKYNYAKAGTYTIKVYSQFPIVNIHISDEYYSLIGASNFVLSPQTVNEIVSFISKSQNAIFSSIDFITGAPTYFNLCSYFDLRENKLTTAQVNNILQHFDNFASSGTTILLSNQVPAAPPSGAGITAKNNLIANGNTVLTD